MRVARSTLPLMAILAGVGLPALSQIQSPNPTSYSNYELLVYHAFFTRAQWLQSQAGRLDALGENGSFLRSTIMREAGLTAAEAASLNVIAADWSAGDLAISNAAKALVASGTAHYSPGLQSLAGQRKQVVADHVDQLKTAMGPARFAVLNAYAHRNTGGLAPPATAAGGR